MFVVEVWPVVIGFIVIVAILIPCVSVLRVYSRYRKVAKALPTPRSVDQAKSVTLDEKRDRLASGLLDDWQKLPQHEIELTRHALWMAMLLEAVSDGSIDRREMNFVADLFGKLAGNIVGARPVMEAAEQILGDQRSALSEISKASGISDLSKEYILAGAFLVSVSDHTLAESETDCLGDIADALAVSQRQRKAIFQSITKRFGI